MNQPTDCCSVPGCSEVTYKYDGKGDAICARHAGMPTMRDRSGQMVAVEWTDDSRTAKAARSKPKPGQPGSNITKPKKKRK